MSNRMLWPGLIAYAKARFDQARDRYLVAQQAFTLDYSNPILLDTEDKVAWANNLELELGSTMYWRLGDHCPRRPKVQT